MKMDSETLTAIEGLKQSLTVVKDRQANFPMSDILLCRLIHFSNRTLEQSAVNALTPEGLLLSQWMVMAVLFGSKDFRRRPQELSMAIGQSGPNTTKTTLFLIDKGWVNRIPDPDNRRSCWMELSKAGQNRVKELLPTMWTAYQTELSPLSENEKTTLTHLLNKLLTGKKIPCAKS